MRQQSNSFLFWKEELLTATVIFACLFFAIIYPAIDPGQKITSGLVFLLTVPVLYFKLILKKSLSDFGFSLRNFREGLLWGGGMLFASLGVALLLVSFSNLKTSYVLPGIIISNFWFFLFYELILINLIFFLQEFFFKGFVLFSFAKKFSYWSIVFSALLYCIFLAFTGGFAWQATPHLILSLAGGITAYKSRSFLYAYFMGLFFLIIFDAYLIYILK